MKNFEITYWGVGAEQICPSAFFRMAKKPAYDEVKCWTNLGYSFCPDSKNILHLKFWLKLFCKKLQNLVKCKVNHKFQQDWSTQRLFQDNASGQLEI